jgi:hypothetical protein
MDWLGAGGRFVIAMAASLLPHRYWEKLPTDIPIEMGALTSGLATMMAGAAVGIPGFLAHAHETTALGIDTMVHRTFTDPNAGYNQGLVQGFAGLSIFTFLLMTPAGWLTMYLLITGTMRGLAAYLDDPFGDPVRTGIDLIVSRGARRRSARRAVEAREAAEGPEVADRLVRPEAAGIPGCDFVIVASRRKAGWERGVAVLTQEGCYRLGEPIERTIKGRVRTLYPFTEHRDFEAIRRSVRYELPGLPPS